MRGALLAVLVVLTACGGGGSSPDEGEGKTSPPKAGSSTPSKLAGRVYIDNHSDQPFEVSLAGESFTVPPWTIVLKQPFSGSQTLEITRDGKTLLKETFQLATGKTFIAEPTATARYHTYRIVYTKTPNPFGNYDNDPRSYEGKPFHALEVKLDYGFGQSVPTALWTQGGFAAKQALRKRTPKELPRGLAERWLAATPADAEWIGKSYSGGDWFTRALEAGQKHGLPGVKAMAFTALAQDTFGGRSRRSTVTRFLAKHGDASWGPDLLAFVEQAYADKPLDSGIVAACAALLDGDQLAELYAGQSDARSRESLLGALRRSTPEKKRPVLMAALKDDSLEADKLVALVGRDGEALVADRAVYAALVARARAIDPPSVHTLSLLRLVLAREAAPDEATVALLVQLVKSPPARAEAQVHSLVGGALQTEAGIRALTEAFPDLSQAGRRAVAQAAAAEDGKREDHVFEALLLQAARDDVDLPTRVAGLNAFCRRPKWFRRPEPRQLILEVAQLRSRPRGVYIDSHRLFEEAKLLEPALRVKVLCNMLGQRGFSKRNILLALRDLEGEHREAAVRESAPSGRRAAWQGARRATRRSRCSPAARTPRRRPTARC